MHKFDFSFSKTSPNTRRKYLKIFKALTAEAEQRYPAQRNIAGHPVFLARHVLQRWPELKPRTRRVYRSAITFIWKAARFEGWEKAVEFMARAESGDPTICAKTHTTTRRLKYVPRPAREALLQSAHMRAEKGHKNAQHLIDFITATLIIGCRPSEWGTVALSSDLETTNMLVNIKNSKHSHLRGNGPDRTLVAKDLSDEEIDSICRTYDFFSTCSTALQKLDEEISITRNAAAENFSGSKQEREELLRISLYSFRHQFVCDCKSNKLDAIVIAALCGHSRSETHRTHYGRPNKGYSTIRVEPTPETLAAVKDYLGPRSEPKPEKPSLDEGPSP